MKIQFLREIFKVIEWKDDCIYRTQSQGIHWITDGLKPEDKNSIYCSISTSKLKEFNYITHRRVSDETQDIVKR